MEDLAKSGFRPAPPGSGPPAGLAGMKKVYGINSKFRQLALGVQYQALDTGKVDGEHLPHRRAGPAAVH
jgi:hypothetical protein